ncbi:MAG TPA: hypothetical protein VFW82_08255 [Dyella sp.]|nr:hypothetical protein [Dyella sp.]
MNTTGFPRLPLRYRLAWMLSWFALLGALALFDAGSPASAVGRPQLSQARLSDVQAGGGEPTRHRERPDSAATTGAAVGQS